jgi:hypothetical protein
VGKAAVTRSAEEAVPRSKVRPGTGGSSQGSASPPYAVVEKVQVLFTENLKGDIFLKCIFFFLFLKEQQLVTAAQRRELYALNLLITKTEQSMFQQSCLNLGLLSRSS